MVNRRVGVVGATSLVGELLLPRLTQQGFEVCAFSRYDPVSKSDLQVEWRRISDGLRPAERRIENWICIAPIFVLPENLPLLEAHGVRRVVALSSTSRFTKHNSTDADEQRVAQQLAQSEKDLKTWAEKRGVALVVLRPTLIYGLGKDKNVSEIARFIRRFGFFPILGTGQGRRQPVHADDVAEACVSCMLAERVEGTYNLSGAETLSYREMVGRVFSALGKPGRTVTVPLWAFRFGLVLMRVLPRYRHWSSAMALRMNRDLVFDHEAATAAFGFRPREFSLTKKELPQ